MSYELDKQKLESAFGDRPDILGAIQQAASAPNWVELFNEISNHVCGLRNSLAAAVAASQSQSHSQSQNDSIEPAAKKRKIEDTALSIQSVGAAAKSNGASTNGGGSATEDDGAPTQLLVKEISVVLPQRKKFSIEFTESRIRARHPESSEVIAGSSFLWRDIAYAFCLPVPEKSQKQYNYILFPHNNSNLPPPRAIPGTTPTPQTDPLVFTIPLTAPKAGTISGPSASTASSIADTYKDLFDYFINTHLKAAGTGITLVEANEKIFASVQREAHRPNEKAVHVKAFRGSKDGYLFFLSTGILWGFKKPLVFLPKERIVSVSYTSVLQRTFNLSVEFDRSDDVDGVKKKVKGEAGNADDAENDDDEDENEEIEFGMLDQEDFEGIDTYVKRNGLQDASMAEQRRAKRLGINVVKGEDGSKVDVGDAGELERAEQELQDAEDEEEEDYDPGSEGESEGEGGSSEEDEDGEGDGDEDGEDEGDEGDEGDEEEEEEE